MGGIVKVILAILLFSPGVVAAADGKTMQDSTVSATVKTLPQKFDLNRVSREQLVGVPGIGPRIAQAIVDLRTKKGSFKRVEELLEVTGIKEKKLAALAGYLEVLPLQISTSATPSVQPK